MKHTIVLITAVVCFSLQASAGQYSNEIAKGPKHLPQQSEAQATSQPSPPPAERQFSATLTQPKERRASKSRPLVLAQNQLGSVHHDRQHSTALAHSKH